MGTPENQFEKRLISAASAGQINVLKNLLAAGGIDLNFQDDEKNLNFWADGFLRGLDWRTMTPPPGHAGKSGNTALMWACHLHRPAVAEALLDAGADPRITNLVGETALHLLDDDTAGLVEKMVAAGADVNAKSVWGVTPFMLAVGQGCKGVALKLLEHGADPYIKMAQGIDIFNFLPPARLDAEFMDQVHVVMAERKKTAAKAEEQRLCEEAENKMARLRDKAPRKKPLRPGHKPKL